MPHKKASYPLEVSPLCGLKSRKRLAYFLSMSPKDLRQLCSGAHSFYVEKDIYIPQKDKTIIAEIPQELMALAHERMKRLLTRIEMPEYVFCPKKGSSIVQNALYHQDSPCLYKVDIKGYFGSTQKEHVYSFFHERMKCPTDISGIFAELSTYDGHLLMGICLPGVP